MTRDDSMNLNLLVLLWLQKDNGHEHVYNAYRGIYPYLYLCIPIILMQSIEMFFNSKKNS